jgi:murein DD-endopeptidase MepM/ murein hydrolase activator NlpD
MSRNKKWWTVQLVPHGKGNVKNFKIRIFPIIFLMTLITLLLVSGLGLSYFFWNVTKQMDLRLNENITQMNQYTEENHALKQTVTQLNNELVELNNDVLDLQEWLEEVELLEQQLREMDGTSSIDTGAEQVAKPLTLRISSLHTPNLTYNPTSIEQLRAKISQLKLDAEQQQNQLALLKEEKEEEQYLAQFIPSIPPSKGRISSPFGWRRDPIHGRMREHQGIDFASSFRSPIYATAHGTVSFAGRNGGYGKQIVIDHGNGYKTTYSHLTSIAIKRWSEVEKGDVIGRMGSTGRSTGVHLHYEVHQNGKPVNPKKFIKGGK